VVVEVAEDLAGELVERVADLRDAERGVAADPPGERDVGPERGGDAGEVGDVAALEPRRP